MPVPADICNRALDAIGRLDLTIGDLTEGTQGSEAMLRIYEPSLRQLLRAAHWGFARKMAPMTMLADATGQTSGVGTVVIAPWIYEYAWPSDCLNARFVPANNQPVTAVAGNISIPTTPLTGVAQPPLGYGNAALCPAPYLLSSDSNYPIDVNSNWQDTEGTSPTSRKVILTNVNQASLVYTALMPYPSTWDALFEQSMVDLLVVRSALALAKDQKLGFAIHKDAVDRLRGSVGVARAASANESGFPQTTDHVPDFLRTRWTGPGRFGEINGYGGGYSAGSLYGSWSGLALGSGNVF